MVVLHYYLLLYLVVTAVSAVILSSMSGDHLLRMRSVLARVAVLFGIIADGVPSALHDRVAIVCL